MKLSEKINLDEFAHLIKFYSNNTVNSLRDIDALKKNKTLILKNIDDDLARDFIAPEKYSQSHDAAVHELKNLKQIINELTTDE